MSIVCTPPPLHDMGLINSRYKSPLDFAAVLLPVITVLPGAPGVISSASLDEQNRHEDGVGPRQEIVQTAGSTGTVG